MSIAVRVGLVQTGCVLIVIISNPSKGTRRILSQSRLCEHSQQCEVCYRIGQHRMKQISHLAFPLSFCYRNVVVARCGNDKSLVQLRFLQELLELLQACSMFWQVIFDVHEHRICCEPRYLGLISLIRFLLSEQMSEIVLHAICDDPRR